MYIVRPVWFSLWRMSLLGLGLGAALGAGYGAAVMAHGALVTDTVDNEGALANLLTLLGAPVPCSSQKSTIGCVDFPMSS